MKGSQKRFLMKNFIIQDQWVKQKNKIGECRAEGHITDPRNTRMEETSRRQRRMEACFEGDQGTEGAVAP
jgi:hypothetical protein